jgi:hypothetical protein
MWSIRTCRRPLLSKDMYGQRRQDRLVMVLWRIEEHLRTADNKVEQGLAALSKLTLEHLIPQAWESHWPLDENQHDPMAWRSARLHNLGNLTLTTGPLNSSLSNLIAAPYPSGGRLAAVKMRSGRPRRRRYLGPPYPAVGGVDANGAAATAPRRSAAAGSAAT